MFVLALTLSLLSQVPSWKDVDALVSEDKYEAASQAVEQRLAAARAQKDEPELARALVRLSKYRGQLGGATTVVDRLRAEPWPEHDPARASVQLFYLATLQNYLGSYGWEIARRERVESKTTLPLDKWTQAEVVAEIARTFADLWRRRDALGKSTLVSLDDVLTPNTFPPGIRDTVREVVAFEWVRFLKDQQWWTPADANGVWKLSHDALLKGGKPGAVALDDEAVHPVERACALLDDLDAWQVAAGRSEASLYTRQERHRLLGDAFPFPEERKARTELLAARLVRDAKLPFSAWVRATLAEWVSSQGDNVRAHQLAAEGARAFPDSVGGKRCVAVMAGLDAPSFSLESMRSDGAGKRSLEVTARNLPTLHLRAYRLDQGRLSSRGSRALELDDDALRALLSKKPAHQWSVDLPPAPDLQQHRTFVTPPMTRPGLYAVVASARPDFVDKQNQLSGLTMFVSNLVLTVFEQEGNPFISAVVRDGASGAPLSGVQVQWLTGPWDGPLTVKAQQRTNADGVVSFTLGTTRPLGGFGSTLVVARRGEDVAVDPNLGDFFAGAQTPVKTALLFTDRSVYRPSQSVQWKVVAYGGQANQGRFAVRPNVPLVVRLRDPNGQEVAKSAVTTNDFGSAAGTFELPPGKLLGRWSLDAEGSSAPVRVEEYKRPTFEVSFRPSPPGAKLNAPLTLTGEARYLFGLPVTAGQARWTVRRTPVFPWWWWDSRDAERTEAIASGTSPLRGDGTFELSFTPVANPRLSKDISYRYSASADLTDEGGETRSATRVLRLGAVAVQATFQLDQGYFTEGQPISVAVRRANLDDEPRAGKGTWRAFALKQPAAALLPADEPVRWFPAPDPLARTEGDQLSPRWSAAGDLHAVLRRAEDGVETARGVLTHAETGVAVIDLPALAAGAWRIRYETTDSSGGTWAMATELVVASPTRFPLMMSGGLVAQSSVVEVGDTARFLVGSALRDLPCLLEVFQDGRLKERRWLNSDRDASVYERPVRPEDRGGFTVRVTAVRDWQVMRWEQIVSVPWSDRALNLEFSTFRDLMHPGSKETFRITVKGATGAVEAGTAEVLTYMYDKSLELFGPHQPPRVAWLYPDRSSAPQAHDPVASVGSVVFSKEDWYQLPETPSLSPDRLVGLEGYSLGGLGLRGTGYGGGGRTSSSGGLQQRRFNTIQVIRGSASAPPEPDTASARMPLSAEGTPAPAMRSDFSETAFFAPQLLTDAKGQVAIEFTLPDSVTSWHVWAHAITKDLRGGTVDREARTVKDLMVRPYLPRFLREGDEAALKVVINNAGTTELKGTLTVDITDPESGASLLAEFAVKDPAPRPFTVKAGQGTTLTIPVTAPKRVGQVAFKVVAKAGELSDGEVRPVPLLPSRLHLLQSRFATLKDTDSRTLKFEDLAKNDDPTRLNEQLVVTIDAQLFSSVLTALPYLSRYPYECTEQTLNRFLSAGIVSSVLRENPAIAAMAKQAATRTTKYETFDGLDANRRLALEETPWLQESQGKSSAREEVLTNLLNPKVVEAERSAALARLEKSQNADGGFPWFPGGPSSPYITLYLLNGFARAAEARVAVPKEVVARAWRSVGQHLRRDFKDCAARERCDLEYLTFLNYVASAWPDASWLGEALSADERKEVLDYSFKHWRQHSPYSKGQLALTLQRAKRKADAKLVFDSVMDSAKTTPDEGTFWQPEARSWLWYNDTIESHAFALRVLMELNPGDARRAGLVQWLLLNKKLGHWKSTRATAEVISSLVAFLRAEKSLGVREESLVTIGPLKRTLVFEPGTYSGAKNQLVVAGPEVDPLTMSSVTVAKATKGFQFASATWHYSTERLPTAASGDFFQVQRSYFKRAGQVLQPLADGATLVPGDQVEVQLSIRAKQAAEYVHLRDPRGAGFEPEGATSRYRFDQGLSWYEEYRDSATNFFFEALPAGEYTLHYRLRANLSGAFRVGPATLQSMYAPEFAATSAGHRLTVGR